MGPSTVLTAVTIVKIYSYTSYIDKKVIDNIYTNVDDYGHITSTEAKKLGVSNAELARQACCGKLVRVARGVYRMPIRPHQEAAPYPVAVNAADRRSYLFGESVVALLRPSR